MTTICSWISLKRNGPILVIKLCYDDRSSMRWLRIYFANTSSWVYQETIQKTVNIYWQYDSSNTAWMTSWNMNDSLVHLLKILSITAKAKDARRICRRKTRLKYFDCLYLTNFIIRRAPGRKMNLTKNMEEHSGKTTRWCCIWRMQQRWYRTQSLYEVWSR